MFKCYCISFEIFKIFKFCLDLYPLAGGEYMLENDPLIVGVGISKAFNKKFIKYSLTSDHYMHVKVLFLMCSLRSDIWGLAYRVCK